MATEIAEKVQPWQELVRGMCDELTTEDLRAVSGQVYAELKSRKKQRDFEASREYRPGDRVEFEDKYGEMIQGTIKTVNEKTVSLHLIGRTNWRVPFSFLTKVDGG